MHSERYATSMSLRLDRPPIVEALLDFRVVARDPEATTESLDAFGRAISAAYPNEVELPHMEDVPASIRALMAAPSARRFRSADGARTVLAGASRLTFSITFDWPERVYSSWTDDLISPAIAVWKAYQEHTRPLALVSLATRYVNRLRVRTDRLGEVLRDPPGLPVDGLSLSSFTDHRSGRTDDGFGAQVGRRLSVYGRDTDRTALLLDVEAFVAYDDAPKAVPFDPDTLADDLARLDEIKNNLFFASLTESALNTYRDDDA